jgi:hypothetical protein
MVGFAGDSVVAAADGERLRLPREEDEVEVEAEDDDEVGGEGADRMAAARSRAARTMSSVQTAAEVAVVVAAADWGDRLRSWWLPWTAWWRCGVRNVLPDCRNSEIQGKQSITDREIQGKRSNKKNSAI